MKREKGKIFHAEPESIENAAFLDFRLAEKDRRKTEDCLQSWLPQRKKRLTTLKFMLLRTR